MSNEYKDYRDASQFASRQIKQNELEQKIFVHPAEGWRPLLNVMARLDMELDIARTCQFEPTHVELGRKELYELKRDWADELAFASDGKTPESVLGLTIVRVDATSHIVLR